MAVAARAEDDVVEVLVEALSEVGLQLVEVDDITETSLAEFPRDLDNHLADNVRNWEPNKHAVWGTIHTYIADGEA